MDNPEKTKREQSTMDNPEKTKGAIKNGQPREDERSNQE
jgi:hypothetical protein